MECPLLAPSSGDKKSIRMMRPTSVKTMPTSEFARHLKAARRMQVRMQRQM